MKVVIVGGVAGGMSAATRLRRLTESAQIVVIERGDHVSFANCGLPYYVRRRGDPETGIAATANARVAGVTVPTGCASAARGSGTRP
ncbi:FAD-dependent oxidoreductase [Nocardia sp. NPDC052112]|uniref:FAD-dependent oxidoreductase n=1 Tax=Nocardia sp. NPDC052112 TaxID=3155646 RepID=UPI003412B9DC